MNTKLEGPLIGAAIFRDFEPKMATVQPNAKSDKRVKTELHEIFEKRLFLWIVATTNENGMMLGVEFECS